MITCGRCGAPGLSRSGQISSMSQLDSFLTQPGRLLERDAAKSSRISLRQVSPETQVSHATTCTTLLCFNSIRVIRASPLAQALEFATPGLVLL
eukprot:9048-Heterococcus_DN1.PRE.1